MLESRSKFCHSSLNVYIYILLLDVTVIISYFNSILCAGHLNKKKKCNKFSPYIKKKILEVTDNGDVTRAHASRQSMLSIFLNDRWKIKTELVLKHLNCDNEGQRCT